MFWIYILSREHNVIGTEKLQQMTSALLSDSYTQESSPVQDAPSGRERKGIC